MKKIIFVIAILTSGVLAFDAPDAHAAAVRISPLEYTSQLGKGEKKKGSVDVTNPSSEAVDLKLYVNGFSQVDNKGNLTFFDSEQIAAGLQLDYDSVTLGPYQTLRLFFLADGTKLPPGDVFAVIFAETVPVKSTGTNTAARVGTLVMITNGTPGSRHAEISQLDVPPLQLGTTVSGTIVIKNPAPPGRATGYFPQISVEITPWGGKRTFDGPLIFAGNTRTAKFELPSNQFGLYSVKVTANNAQKTVYVFMITGWWRLVVVLGVIAIVAAAVLLKKYGQLRLKPKRRQKIRFERWRKIKK